MSHLLRKLWAGLTVWLGYAQIALGMFLEMLPDLLPIFGAPELNTWLMANMGPMFPKYVIVMGVLTWVSRLRKQILAVIPKGT